jgi:diguanylate cyclase (GGDEF)-like protein
VGCPLDHRTAPRRRAVDPLVVGLIAVVSVAAVGYGTDLGAGVPQLVGYWSVSFVLELTMFVLSRRVYRNPAVAAPTRRLWWAMGFAGLAYAAGVVCQIPTVIADPGAPAAALGGPAYALCVLVGTLWLVWTMLTSPLGLRSGRERTRFWLDVATVMVAAATFGCYFTYLGHGGDSTLSTVLTLLIGPTAFLVGVFAAVKLLLGGQAPFTLAAGLLGTAAAVGEGLCRILQQTLVTHDRIGWNFWLQIVVVALLAGSARAQERAATAGPGRATMRRRPYSMLPYLAIGVTYLLLVVVLGTAGLDGKAWIVVGGALGSTALVVGRQLTAFTDNARLLAELDQKVVELHAALTERDELAARLHHQAFHDNLTGLANRALFLQRLDTAARDRRTGRDLLVVMLVDLDDFKPVNDLHGHSAGDHVLTEVGRRLRACVRGSDLVARLGGDEYAILMDGVPPDHDLAALADRLVGAVSEPVDVAGTPVSVGASVGIAVAPPGDTPAGEVLHRADMAMYSAKSRGKRTYQIAL